MDFLANVSGNVLSAAPYPNLGLDHPIVTYFGSLTTVGITTVLVAFVTFLCYEAYRPKVHPKSPAFISDTIPILGSIGSFWKDALEQSKTGNFSFWQGKIHIVGISGPAARKMLLDHPSLDFVAAQSLLAFGMHFWPPIHEIFQQTGERARNNTHFLRTLLGLLKTARIERVLSGLLEDARLDFQALLPESPNGVVNAPDLWRTVFKQSTRLFFADDFAVDKQLFDRTADHLEVILHSYSPFYAFRHWILEPSMIRRRLARRGLRQTVQKLVAQRKRYGFKYKDDALQTMIDNGDPEEFITEFCASATFITTTNAHIIFPQLINTMAVHPEWQEKVYREVYAVAKEHCTNKSLPLVEQLKYVPLKAWETSFPMLDLCIYEIIRVWTSFAVGRLNTSSEAILIPGSDEVIPAGAYGVWNSTELNFDAKLFPNPRKFDPMRFAEGRREFEKEPYGFFGWGLGMHPCAGKRWGKLQQNILIAHALATYKWTSCDVNGKADPYAAQRQDMGAELDSEKKFALPPAYCKMEPRK
ncbi:Cytochrome P450 CYP5282A1 [Beauveria bassiana ARSEF 2860]|uniref:Cytochrome P450 CYP5282A1 n=1 Tax=Beauveria bassiana (strain ARSEF 2860) TaxID=655819 RepID=J4WCS3_BEAB2|nr:Cytochrome P450 CYP5282A1 [Beauveria bassiana ARSEF 2860]EJP67855.1 Cytochrome P450 CYP5282A1 [Beauveria bassiana ARSEF 2860]